MTSVPRNYTHMNGDGKGTRNTKVQRNVEVRCLVALDDDETFQQKNCKSVFSVGIPECPTMRERLAKHIRECHGRNVQKTEFGTCNSDCQTLQLDLKAPKQFSHQEVLTDFYGKSIALSPTISMDDRFSISYKRDERDKHIRSNHKNNVKDTFINNKDYDQHDPKETREEPKIQQCETVILHPRGQYKDNLQNVILQWLIDIPVFRNINQESNITRDNAVNVLNEAIFNLSVDINNDLYEENVKTHIDNFLEVLPIRFPCHVGEQDRFKNNLKNNLLDRITKLNKELFNAGIDKNTYVRNCSRRKTDINFQIEKLVLNYLANLTFVERDDWGCLLNMQAVNNVVKQRLRFILKRLTQEGDNNLFLKTELINILRDIPLAWPHNTEERLNKHAQVLTHNIIAIQNNKYFYQNSYVRNLEAKVCFDLYEENFIKRELTQEIIQLINSIIDTDDIRYREEELVNILLNSFDSIQSGNETQAKSEIYEFFNESYDITETNALFLTNNIVEKIKNVTKSVTDKSYSAMFFHKDMLSNNVVVYVSDHDLSGSGPCNYPITSTPKNTLNKENAEEKKYIDELSKVIDSWLDGVPELGHVKLDKNYKEVMVSDLAGHLMDEMKLEQYTLDTNYYGSTENMIRCAIRSWIIKFEENAFKNIDDVKPHMDSLIDKFKNIQVPVLTKPQYGNRHDMKAAIFRRHFSDENIEFVPESTDILEDGISIWMNEQASQIFSNENRDARNEMLHDFVLKIQNELKNKRQSQDIKLEAKKWLDKILKPGAKKNIDYLSEDLKDRIMKIPLSDTFIGKSKKKEMILEESIDEQNERTEENIDDKISDLEKTLTGFIDKFVEHNWEEADILVKGAYSELLKSEFRRYSPHEKNELYSSCETKCKSKDMLPQKLTRELYYIKEVSDWLKNIPIDNSFNLPGNKKRMDFVINLARDICEVEMDRMQAPDAMEYEKYLAQLISRNYILKLPILPNCQQYQPQIIKELIKRIKKSRDDLNQNLNKNNFTNDSLHEQNLGEFIDEYIRVNGKHIADDPVKLEAWTGRLLKEINRMVHESEPNASFKMKVYDRLAEIPVPGVDSVVEFDRKLIYAHEIGDWIKNMPLQPISDQETTVMIVTMISDLAEKISEKHSVKNIKDDSDLMNFVIKWILTLPLEPAKEIDVSILIQQLSNRIRKVDEGKNQSLNESNNDQYDRSASKTYHDLQQIVPKPRCNSVTNSKSKVGCSGEFIVNAIDEWCDKLPIKNTNKYNEKPIKDNIAIRLFQKVGDMHLDPRFNDDILYRDELNHEIDDIFKDLQESCDVIKNKDELKWSLVNDIVESRAIIKEQTAGDYYRHKLKNTIEASIPAPITYNKIYDPGFELYKNKLANMFILENFDHGDDLVKLKYEVKIKDEINKYFREAQKRNAFPLSRDEIYNELYLALFKVPIPNESSVIKEVEEVKLRCVIDGWFESLPIREAVNLNELLDWDKILAMLAKRIYEIEKNKTGADDLTHKEITKWLVKFPLLPGHEQNIDKLAKSLEDKLKSSKYERKCIPKSKASKKGKSIKKSKTRRESLNKSQVAGPSGASPIRHDSSIRDATQMSGVIGNPCCVAASTPRRKPAEQDIVENWCQNLPLHNEPGLKENLETLKDNLATKILRKLSELNANPEIFDDDFLYDEYLDDELDGLIKTLPMCCELQKSTEIRKYQLISALRSIKPLLRAERARHVYKKEVKNTIRNMLQAPLETTPEKDLLEDLVDEIADSFIQYNYNKDDYEGKQIYKNQVRDAIIKFYSEVGDKTNDNSLLKQNKLLCELAKIPIPSEAALKEIVEETKMKEEVSNFLEEVIPDESTDEKKHIKSNLSKRLHEIEKSGHSCSTDKAMTEEIARSLKKVNTEVNVNKIENFVNTLRNNESLRKSSPIRKPDGLPTSMNVSQQRQQHGWQAAQHMSDDSAEPNYEYQPSNYPTFSSSPDDNISYQYLPSQSVKYHTLLPDGQDYNPPQQVIQHRPQTTQWYEPQRVPTNESQNWHSLPPLSPGYRLPPPPEIASNTPTWHTLPTPSSAYKQPLQRFQSMLHSPRSAQSIRPVTPERSAHTGEMSSPSRDIDNRFLPRPQARRQSTDIPFTERDYMPQRRASLQDPLRYDYNLYDNRNIPKTYRELCIQPQVIPSQSPLNVVVFDNAATSSGSSQPQLTILPHPASPVQPIRPMISTQQPSIRSTPLSPRSIQPNQSQVVSNLSSPQQLSTQSAQNYQGFQNAVPAVSSSARLQNSAQPNIPISTVPQSTRNAATIREDGGPTISNIPQETPEDVSPPEGTHRMAAAPHGMTNPPRKRRRIRSPDEEERDEICDCLHHRGRKRRCIPLPDDCRRFPLWCYMPFPSFCYF